MNEHREDDMDQLFASFYADRHSEAPRPLVSWIDDRPDLSAQFIQWATEIPALATAELMPASPDFESRSLAIGQAILQRHGLAASVGAGLSSLNDAARRCGSTPREAARRIGVGMSIFAKLNRRLISAGTIPARLLDRTAETLRLSLEEVRDYLAQPPALAAGAAYRSDAPPSVSEPQDFAEAVRTSPDMTDAEKLEWLS
jgi:hypothetical protein